MQRVVSCRRALIAVFRASHQFVKCGFAGNNLPDHQFPSCVGRPTLRAEEDVIGDIDLKAVMCGDEADSARRGLRISYPIDNGKVLNWDDMEHLWNYIFFDKLKIDPSERRIMLTEAPMNPMSNRIKMTEMMFEKYGFEGAHIDIQALLVLYSQGTGVAFRGVRACVHGVLAQACSTESWWTQVTV